MSRDFAFGAVLGVLIYLAIRQVWEFHRPTGRYPEPAVGQIWRCERNGNLLRVSRIDQSDMGTFDVVIQRYSPDRNCWGIPDNYVYGLNYASLMRKWAQKLRQEKRVLLDPASPDIPQNALMAL